MANSRIPRWLLRPRFRLRTFLLLLVCLSAPLGYWAHRANEQRRAAAWIVSHGGAVFYDFELEDNVQRLAYSTSEAAPPAPQWMIDAFGVDYFARVEGAIIRTPEEGLRSLAALPHVRVLNLTTYENTDLASLFDMKRLQYLEL
jgi:hypothetical protein